MRDRGVLRSKWYFCIYPLSMTKWYYRGGERETVRAGGREHLQRNTICWALWECCIHELSEAVTAWTRPAENPASPNPSMFGRRANKVPFLSEDLLTTGGFWARENQFSQGCISFLKDATHHPVADPAPICIQSALSGLSGLLKKNTLLDVAAHL